MISLFAHIKVIIWDFDGTLYKPNIELYKAVREGEYQTIMKHTGWSLAKTIIEFEKIYLHRFSSATQTAAFLSHITVSQAAVEMEEFFDRRNFLQRDEKIITLFKKVKKYRHFILANGVIAKYKDCLKVLGIAGSIFENIITAETVGKTKPDLAGFMYILKKTNLPPRVHLMIGDRENIDLVPAKALGMKTCLVWSDIKGKNVDYTAPTVYDVAKILL